MNPGTTGGARWAAIPASVGTDLLRLSMLLTALLSGAASAAGTGNDLLVETGRRIYQEGVLPGGEPLLAMRPEGFVIEGVYAACASCHRRSGMGSVEGNVENTILVPPVAGPVLFTDGRFANSELDKSHHYVPNDAWERAVTRPAYDRQTLARVLRQGIESGGKRLTGPMPLYGLDEGAMAALGAYLEQLTAAPAPGVEPEILHLATVVTADVTPWQADSVVSVLRAWSDSARASGKQWRLHVWELAGAAETWLAQLQEHYARQPVFALLSGAGGSEWAPVHEFCEQSRLACVLPSVEVAPVKEGDWYSMYYSPGVNLEARILARYLGESSASIVQLYSDASGRHAADTLAFSLGAAPASFSIHRFRATSPGLALEDITRDDVLVLWLRPAEIEQLVAAAPQGLPAQTVFLSALLATPEDVSLPAAWKQNVRFVSLFDDLGLQAEIARLRLERWLELNGLADKGIRRLQADAYAASYLLSEALGGIGKEEVRRPAVPLSREHLLEVLEDLVDKYDDLTPQVDTDSHIAYYGRMSLGPRQRVAVRGGSILRYISPDSGRLTPVGKRIVP